MTIYNFNHGIGWASSGVEYAQAYRAKIFKKNKQKAKFIFTDWFTENIQSLTSNIGFENDDIIWLYQYFTDIPLHSTTFSLKDLESSFPFEPLNIEHTPESVNYIFNQSYLCVRAFLEKGSEHKVFKTEIEVNGQLIQKDYYSRVKVASEYFKRFNNQTYLYQRRFFNSDGSLSYDELIDGEQHMYVFDNFTLYSKEELFTYFIAQLRLNNKDIIIIDRSSRIAPQVLKNKGEAKIGVVIHAEHFNAQMTSKYHILWNNHYDYVFENTHSIDFFITATSKQKEMLETQFKEYGKFLNKVYCIPVGSVEELQFCESKKPYSMITASRLSEEKHVDWLIHATVRAKKRIKNLSLDIYGRGGELFRLQSIIEDYQAQNYIRLRGHCDLTNVYKEYETYISASRSEGFGLTLLESVASGLCMIGFDVPYGNQTFIHHQENGLLVQYDKDKVKRNIKMLSEAIIALYEKEDSLLSRMSRASYQIAEEYLTKIVQRMWKELEKELINGD